MKTTLITVLVVTLLGIAPAFAHARLLGETPADKAVLSAAPTVLTLKFSEGIALKFSRVTVIGPGNIPVPLGTPSLDPNDDTVLTVPLVATLVPGLYSVAWQALSSDGHKTTGSYTFMVK